MTNIVMICRNRVRLLRQTLESLRAHTDSSQYNLTIVDDGSSDFRLEVLLAKHAEMPNTTVLRIINSGHVLSQLKNIGAAVSQQIFGMWDWLYLSDSDVYFTEDWLEKLTKQADLIDGIAPDYTLFGGQVHPFHKPLREVGNNMLEYNILDGPSWLMRWDTWDWMGGLRRDTAPGPCQSEEYPFCQELLDSDGHIYVITPHVVIHTGLTQTDGKDAPGRELRESQKVPGVIYE